MRIFQWKLQATPHTPHVFAHTYAFVTFIKFVKVIHINYDLVLYRRTGPSQIEKP